LALARQNTAALNLAMANVARHIWHGTLAEGFIEAAFNRENYRVQHNELVVLSSPYSFIPTATFHA
jgi:hypothetical protein